MRELPYACSDKVLNNKLNNGEKAVDGGKKKFVFEQKYRRLGRLDERHVCAVCRSVESASPSGIAWPKPTAADMSVSEERSRDTNRHATRTDERANNAENH